MLLPQFTNAKERMVLNGYWFECEFSEKTAPPKDQCEMLDDDGFNFKEDVAINIKNISSKETKCKKNKIDFMCTPFDIKGAKEINKLVDIFKISSSVNA